MRLGVYGVGLLLALPPVLEAQVVAKCDEPTGSRYDMVAGTVQSQSDGFTGVRPILVLSTNPDSTVLSYNWGPAKWAADAGMPAAAQQAIIVSRIPEKVTAIAVLDDPAGVVQMISLFPTKGLVMMSQHKYMQVAEGVPDAGTFYAKCRVGSG